MNNKCSTLKDFPSRISSPTLLSRMITQLNSLSVCAGNPDDQFLQMAHSRKGVFLNSSNEPTASVDDYFPVKFEGVVYSKTIRSSKCEVLVDGARCESCKNYRPTLRSLYSRWSNRQASCSTQHTSVSSHTNYR